jgi:hypothetical protein
MISFNYLGNLGRLANQMFQYASLMGIASNRKLEYCIPPKHVFGKFDSLVRTSDTNLYECFDIKPQNTAVTDYKNREESGFAFDENLFNFCEDKTNINGYFQTEKYFKHIKDDVRKEFSFKPEIFEPSKIKFKEFFSGSEVISLHIRRGDYVVNPNHPVQTLEYYQNALNLLDNNLPVLIVSDDPKWCNEQDIFADDRFFVSDLGNTNVDLCLITLCNYHIIANSSFSWWGAWLANSKKTIAPKNWFGGDCINHNTQDLYCPNWIIM